jgi:hypothetical protein
MKPSIVLTLIAMLFASDIWAVYGVSLPPRAADFEDCEVRSQPCVWVTTTDECTEGLPNRFRS